MTRMASCPECGGPPLLCEPNYADEHGTMVVCETCDFAGDSFVLGMYGEGRDQAIEAWNALTRGTSVVTTSWWVLGTKDKKLFVGWSCGTPGDLQDAAVYRSQDNAEKKLKDLHKFCPGEYTDYEAHEVDVTL